VVDGDHVWGARFHPQRGARGLLAAYAEEAVAFLVEDHRREEFASIGPSSRARLRIGAAPVPEWLEAVQRALPKRRSCR